MKIAIDRVFIGSCTNARIEDLRAAAKVVAGHHVNAKVRAMVVPGSQKVKAQAEKEGLDEIFRAAGFEWREPGCSMCLGMNPDILQPGERCASTSNRNFEGRQGRGGRTHLVSPDDGGGGGHHRSLYRCADMGIQKGRGDGIMQSFRTLTSGVMPLDRVNVDTDQIIPKQFLKRIERTGYGEFLFFDWRQDKNFELNDARYRGAQILVAAKNFGCGSSREHAAWALSDYGFRCVIAPSFADIFHSNAGKNGILLVTLPEEQVQTLLDRAEQIPHYRLTVSLEDQTVKDEEGSRRRSRWILSGAIACCRVWTISRLSLRHADELDKFEQQHEAAFWVAPKPEGTAHA